MRANHGFLRKESNNSAVEGEYEIYFDSAAYVFPNDADVCRRCKSFVTHLRVEGELSERQNRKLSLVNRSHFLVKLKQIKQDDSPSHNQSSYLLFYQAVPYELSYVKATQMASQGQFNLEKAIKEVISDLTEFNIFSEIGIQQCGFTEQGQFRVYVPPLQVLNDRKLTLQQKQRMNISVSNILRFWQGDNNHLITQNASTATARQSYRFNSPHPKEDRLSEEHTDIKKTIKLSKQYQRESKGEICHQLKKHKSMEYLRQQQEKTATHFISKIQELNKKISNIREAFISKRSSDHPRDSLGNFVSRQRNRKNLLTYISPPKEDHYQEEVIFEKKENGNEQPEVEKEDDRQSIDTYLQEIGNEYTMPKFAPINQLRNTTLPTELQAIKNSLLAHRDNKSNWHHESAGGALFKRFIQRNKDIYPELNQPRESTSLSKMSANDRKSRQFRKEASQQRLKKMVSLESFELNAENSSVNLSEFSNELSNAKRRRQKQQRNRIMKHKIQDILIKSKKAIELLKNPHKQRK